jgi:predicted transcriptional regulator
VEAFTVGWEPQTHVRRLITLPDALDRQVARVAASRETTPSAVIAEGVALYLEGVNGDGDRAHGSLEDGPVVQRTVVFPEDVDTRLDVWAREHDLGLSEVVAAALASEYSAAGSG